MLVDATILLVEDNPDHAELTLRALRALVLPVSVVWVKDGADALDYLYGRGTYAVVPAVRRPSLILLDIKLPKVDGHEVLRRIKTDEALRAIPVVMLTTSTRDDEVLEAYSAGAEAFVPKPVRVDDLVEQVASLTGRGGTTP
ncbi:MAG: response regulator [Candidatus Rokubacteria bacterium]|nr:response regulator [Candidatus Rokubacteria bacterium]MBI3825796.1 response regulator [Candidatus Rokubacteria bacterium]